MQPGSRLLIVEHIIEPDPTQGRPTDYLVDIQMMAMFGSARARTEDEFRKLLAEIWICASSTHCDQIACVHPGMSGGMKRREVRSPTGRSAAGALLEADVGH